MSGNRSARTWVGGKGHLPLPDARRWAVEQVELIEDEVAEQITKVQASKAASDAAEKQRLADLIRLRDLNARLARARDDLAYRMGDGTDSTPTPEAKP